MPGTQANCERIMADHLVFYPSSLQCIRCSGTDIKIEVNFSGTYCVIECLDCPKLNPDAPVAEKDKS